MRDKDIFDFDVDEHQNQHQHKPAERKRKKRRALTALDIPPEGDDDSDSDFGAAGSRAKKRSKKQKRSKTAPIPIIELSSDDDKTATATGKKPARSNTGDHDLLPPLPKPKRKKKDLTEELHDYLPLPVKDAAAFVVDLTLDHLVLPTQKKQEYDPVVENATQHPESTLPDPPGVYMTTTVDPEYDVLVNSPPGGPPPAPPPPPPPPQQPKRKKRRAKTDSALAEFDSDRSMSSGAGLRIASEWRAAKGKAMQNLSSDKTSPPPQRGGIPSVDDTLPVEDHGVGEAAEPGKKAPRKKGPPAKKQKGKKAACKEGDVIEEGPIGDGTKGVQDDLANTALVSSSDRGQLPPLSPPGERQLPARRANSKRRLTEDDMDEPLSSPPPEPMKTPRDRKAKKAIEAPADDGCYDSTVAVAPLTSTKRNQTKTAEKAAQDGGEDPPPPAAGAKRKGGRKKLGDRLQHGEEEPPAPAPVATAAPEEPGEPAVDPTATPQPKEPGKEKATQPEKRGPHSPIREGKVPHRVGLSKRARIEPLLSIRRK